MRIVHWLVPVLLAIMCGCAAKPPTAQWPHLSGAVLTDQGAPASLETVVAKARSADFVLLGEGHTNLCDHAVQAQILEHLAQTGHRFSIGLEMLPVPAQPALDRFASKEISLDTLEQEINWRQNWGHPFHFYQPVFEIAARYNLPLVALNLPRHVLVAARDGLAHDLPAHEQAMLPKKLIPVHPAQEHALREQADMHLAMHTAGPGAASAQGRPVTQAAQRFFLVQALWDSTMAEHALAGRATWGLPMVILAGAGHVEHGWGIASRIHALEPSATILGLVPVRDEKDFARQTGQPALAGELMYVYCAAQHRSRLGMHVVFADQTVRVTEIIPDSPADKAGLHAEDRLIAAGGKPLATATDLHFAAMAASRAQQPLALTVQRGTQILHLMLPLQ
ncbi:MAG: PDZ domain-containing protein [Desulfovibrionales bacterium]|nr:PDZ domain-containing protein [Desulfovibrionales bacterium]